jgi:hypothetical protein
MLIPGRSDTHGSQRRSRAWNFDRSSQPGGARRSAASLHDDALLAVGLSIDLNPLAAKIAEVPGIDRRRSAGRSIGAGSNEEVSGRRTPCSALGRNVALKFLAYGT